MAFPWPWRSRSAAATDSNDVIQAAVADAVAQLKAQGIGAQSIADGIQNVVAGLNTNRDKNSYSIYAPARPMGQLELENLYRTAWLPGRIVDTVTEDMTREWVSLSWDGNKDDEGGVKALAAAESKLAVRAQIADGVRWGRLHGGAGAVLRLKNDGLSLHEPLDPGTVGKDDLVAVNTFDRWFLNPLTGEGMDETPGANFGLPQFYSLTGLGGGMAIPRIHASRIIRFNGAKTPMQSFIGNGYWCDSVLMKPQDAIKHYDQTTSGIASMVWESSVDIILASGLAQQLATKDGEAKVTARFLAAAIMKSFNRMVLLDKDKEDWKQKTISFAGLKDVLAGMMNDVSGAADIPLTRLYGQSPAGMNATGESDTRNYYDHIKSKQTSDLKPQLEYLYEILVRSTLGTMPDGFAVTFNSLWQQNAKEQAETEKARAETRKIYFDMGVLDEGGIARELHADGSMKTMETADVKLAEELAKQPEPAPVVVAPANGVPPKTPEKAPPTA